MLIEPAEATEVFRAQWRRLAIYSLLLSSLSAAATGAFAQLGPTALSGPSEAQNSTYPQAEAGRSSRHASVTYSDGLLTVAANNSSLNQILREIARQTGMKITGGVTDDHVFGTYGPATPSVVLATLLDGTSSNMLIVQDGTQTPMQLILTPRIGGVTPPNPNASGSDDSDTPAASAPVPVRPAPPLPAVQENSRAPNRAGTGGIDVNPAATAPSSTSQQLAFPPIDQTTPPSTATTTPLAPDAPADTVKTPQQIFEQLQKLRQQQPQTGKPQ